MTGSLSFSNGRAELFAWLVLALGIGLTVWIYHFGWSLAPFFDDGPNLDPIKAAYAKGALSLEGAGEFIFSGRAGPTGRPVALLSFLVDGFAWPSEPGRLLYTNTLLHALNGFLVTWVAFLLAPAVQCDARKRLFLAVGTGLLWVSLPLLSTTALAIVQRMAILSATFVFLALVLYLKGRNFAASGRMKASAYAFLGVGGCAVLGVFAKESAAILPLILFVTERILFRETGWGGYVNMGRVIKWVFIYIPSLALVVYLVHIGVQGVSSVGSHRSFGSLERLAAESVILWNYLKLAVVPIASDLGVFHDDIHASTMPSAIVVGLSFLAWAGVFSLAFALRRRSFVPLFVIGWFFAAHVLESSVIPLELYFEHRNYVAAFGLAFGGAFLAWSVGEWLRSRWMPYAVMSGYLVLNGIVLMQNTTLMGQQRLAAEIWFANHPESPRAAQHLSQQLVANAELVGALRVIDDAARRNPSAGILELQGLQLACAMEIGSPSDIEDRFQRAIAGLQFSRNSYAIGDALSKLGGALDSGKCEGVLTNERLLRIARAALGNSRISSQEQNVANIELFIATRFAAQGDLDQTMRHLERALRAKPDAATVRLGVKMLMSAGLYDEAKKFSDKYACAVPPRNVTQVLLRKAALLSDPCEVR